MGEYTMFEDACAIIHPEILGHYAFRDHGEVMAFVYLVLRAAWKPTRQWHKGREIVLERGQLAMSVRDLADAMKRSRGWSQRFLDRLEEAALISRTSERGAAPAIVTINECDLYSVGG